uniref:TAP-like protein n=1 Tax=Candidatus Kentrum sp. TC TaxID=2126339 RepID=A0A450ZEP7_9GAMM|nr:MAG: hypothetical protein BECKTC1821D_GA0114238_11621 [Candidatus Kentron sp. TC]
MHTPPSGEFEQVVLYRYGPAQVGLSQTATPVSVWPHRLGLSQRCLRLTLRPNMLEKASYVTPGDIEACGIPFRILASEWDPVFPAALLEGVARDIGASYAYTPSAGHSTYFERPEAFNAALRAFLAD